MARTKKSAPAKYSDKSAGQPELLPVFDALRNAISAYAGGNFRPKSDKPGAYELYYDKEAQVAGRKFPELAFAAALIQKGYVGFYFFPVYMDTTLKSQIAPELLKKLKGKSCFHIDVDDPVLMTQIDDALRAGHAYFEKNGWK